MAVEFTGGMRSYFDVDVTNIYDDDMAQRRYEQVNAQFRKEIESVVGRAEEEILSRSDGDRSSRMRIDGCRTSPSASGRWRWSARSSFSIEEGELFTLLGPSGCGKTTLLRLIAGFYAPDEGEIRFDGRSGQRRAAARARHRHGVPELRAVAAHDGVRERRLRAEAAQDRARRDRRARSSAVLEKVKLGGLGDRYPGQLSGGQQQRVALARALVLNPKILLLDEPLSNLDAKIRVQVRAEIRKLQKELGITTVYVTHDQEEALTLSDRIAVFNQGKVFQIGPPKALYERPANRFVADFIGINNLIDGTVAAVDAAQRRLRVKTALGRAVGAARRALRGRATAACCASAPRTPRSTASRDRTAIS